MESVKYYHVSDSGLVEGVALGRTTVVLVSDFSRVSAENEALQLLLNNRAALAEPVPPAGGDVEVIAWLYDDGEGTRGVTDRWDVAKHTPSVVAQLVDRANVTRLQAEVEDLRRRCTHVNSQLVSTKFELEETRDAYLNQSSRLVGSESELTKARELIGDLRADTQSGYLKAVQALHNWANQSAPRGYSNTVMTGTSCNQSAPADKGQGEPVAWLSQNTLHPEVLELSEPNFVSKSSDWAPAFPVYRKPAPVAAVMPERIKHRAENPAGRISYIKGWNACLDELAHLNSEQKP